MPLNLFYTMVQKSQKWPKTQIKGGPALKEDTKKWFSSKVQFLALQWCLFKGSVERSRPEQHFCSLLPYFLLSWLQIFQLYLSSRTLSSDLFLFKKSFRKKKNIRKTTQNAFIAASIFIVFWIVLNLGTPLLHTQAQNMFLQNFYFALEVETWTKNLQKRCFTSPGRLWRSKTFFAGRN